MKSWKESKDDYRGLLASRYRLLESKDHIIDGLNLTDEQKTLLKDFFKKHPNYESKIDWNKKDLKWEDFAGTVALEGKSRSQARKNGLEGLVKDKDYKFITSGTTEDGYSYDIYMPLNHLGSVTLASRKVGYPQAAQWCISSNSDSFWNHYTYKLNAVFFFIIFDSEASFEDDLSPKYAFEIEDMEVSLWDMEDDKVYEYSRNENSLPHFSQTEEDLNSTISDVLYKESPLMYKYYNEIFAKRNDSLIEKFNDMVQNMRFFKEDGTFHAKNLKMLSRQVINMIPSCDSYLESHPISLKVPSTYNGESYPYEDLDWDDTHYTLDVDDWDSEDIDVFHTISTLDMSDTNIKVLTHDFGEVFSEIHHFVFPKTLTTIEDHGMEACWHASELDFSNTQLETIGDSAFSSFGLFKVHLPGTVRKIGEEVFAKRPNRYKEIIFDMPYKQFLGLFSKEDLERDRYSNSIQPKCFHEILCEDGKIFKFSDCEKSLDEIREYWTRRYDSYFPKNKHTVTRDEDIPF